VGPGADADRCGKSRPTGIRSPDLPSRSESLYRLRYTGSTDKSVLGGKIWRVHVPMTATVPKKASGKL
jgi:hypothetical protein